MNCTDTVLMVIPKHFSFNPETEKSNAFQKKIALTQASINRKAQEEFKQVVNTLQTNSINTLLLDSPIEYTPDAVFPNNWFSTHIINDKKFLFVYPMLCENRKKEVQLKALQTLFKNKLKTNYEVIDLRIQNNISLEGTGVLIFDRNKKIAFMSISDRTNIELAKDLTDKLDYELITFESFDKNEKAIYHTNVMMSIGEHLAFVCLEAIKPIATKKQIEQKLTHLNKTIIELSIDQIYQMAGNVLELVNNEDKHFLLLSSTADNSLTSQQKSVIDRFCTRLPCDITTIEAIGGGSIRCMLAEIFH